MRRELFLHFSFWFSFFVFIAIIKHYLNLSAWPFWVGGIVGIFLPDLDHLIYVLFVQPQELTAQRVNYLVHHREFWRTVELLYETRTERNGLIFHTILFQIIFVILTFWMVSSSGSLFGKGLVLSFSLHLVIDQIVDLVELENFDNWQKNLPFRFNLDQARVYWLVALGVLILCSSL